MPGDAHLATRAATKLRVEGVYVVGFWYPVVPKGEARIRAQRTAAHTTADVEFAAAAFQRVGKPLGVIP